MSPTTKQRHRIAAFSLHRNDLGLVRCALRDVHECGGRLQAHHAVPVQTLTRLHRQAALAARTRPDALLAWEQALIFVSLDDLIAEGRNSEVVCELGHRQVELGRFVIEPSEHLREFCADYHLEHLIADERDAA